MEIFRQRRARRHDASYDYEKPQNRLVGESLRTDATEILGENQSLKVRGLIKTKEIINGITLGANEVREPFLELRKVRAEQKADRLRHKIQNSTNNPVNTVFNRLRKQKISNLEFKSKVFSDKISKIDKFESSVKEENELLIDNLISKKIDAQRSKAERIYIKKQNKTELNPKERAEFIKNLTAQDRQKITEIAIQLVRKKNIEKGRLKKDHKVNIGKAVVRAGYDYERTIP